MLISFGIPAFDTQEKLSALLTSLSRLETSVDYEIIVGDDCHPSNLAAFVEANFPHVQVFRNSENRGPAYTRNRIIERAKGQYITFFDADCVIPGDWLNHVVPHLAPDVMIAGMVDRPDGSREWGPRRSTWLGASLPADPEQATVASSNNMTLSLAMAKKSGGFNEALRIYFEDSLFSIRFNQLGGTVQYLESARVVHNHNSSANPKRIEQQSRNTLWGMHSIYAPSLRAWALLICLTGFYLAKALIYLLRGKPSIANSYLRGTLQGLSNILKKPLRHDWLAPSAS